jgi:hypothetical protein
LQRARQPGSRTGDCVRGVAIARPVARPTRKESRGSRHDAATGVIEMSPKEASARAREKNEGDHGPVRDAPSRQLPRRLGRVSCQGDGFVGQLGSTSVVSDHAYPVGGRCSHTARPIPPARGCRSRADRSPSASRVQYARSASWFASAQVSQRNFRLMFQSRALGGYGLGLCARAASRRSPRPIFSMTTYVLSSRGTSSQRVRRRPSHATRPYGVSNAGPRAGRG